MIYLKNNTETQAIYIPRQTVLGGGYIATTKTYEDGYRDGLEDGKEQQKGKLLNLYVTENGQYEREDGWGVVTVDTPDSIDAYNKGYEDGYNQGQAECPELTEITIVENGRYEGAYNVVNVDVPTEGGTCNLGEGSILLDTSMAGTYELYAADDGYDGWSKFIVTLEGGEAIKVHKASDLLDTFNNGGTIDYGTYHYVGGKITNIKEVNTQYGNATYTLDNGFLIYRGKWTNGEPFRSEDQIKVGAYIVVYGVLKDYNGQLELDKNSQVIAYQECTGGEIISCNLEDKSVTPSMSDRDENGLIVVNPSEGYDGLSRTVIDPQNIYNEGVEAGRAEGGSANLINPIIFSETEGNTINAENVQIPTFVYEGNQYYNVGVLNMADYEEFKIQIRFHPTNGGNAEPINIFGCENTDWDGTTFGARIYQGQIYFRMSGQDVVSPYTENTWYDVEMGYNTTKRWVIVNRETLLETNHTSFNRPSQTLMIGAINSGGNAFRPFYGKIAATYLEANGNQVWLLPKNEGYMDVYWNDRSLPWIQLNGENNARFENEYMSGDGMKSITWLGKRVTCPSAQEQITDYYYCPITITDNGFGDRAKSFMVKNESMYGENSWINDDSFVYLPTANNMNEVRTKTSPSLVASFPFDDNAAQYTGALYMNVEQIQMNNVVLPNLYKLELGSGCHTLRMESSNLPNINTLIIRYNGQQLFDYHFSLTQFKNGGKLYVYEGLGNAENLRAALGSEWTIEYL